MATSLQSIVLVLIGSFIGSFGALFLKKGALSISIHNPLKTAKNIYIWAGVLLYGLSSVFWIFAIRGGELTVLYPMVATVYIWTTLLSIRFLHESMNMKKWLGLALILVGVSLIGLGS